jgi:hypothetical protein
MRIVFVALAAFALALLAGCEIVLRYPVAGWLYLLVAIAFAAALVRSAPIRSQLPRVAVLAAVLALIGALYRVEWTSRKPFLRDLDRVRVGMTEAEVRQVMARYLEGTGWPASPGLGSAETSGPSNSDGAGSEGSGGTSSADQLHLRDSLVFRHSNHADFNSDWGIVSFADGRVVRVEFNAD